MILATRLNGKLLGMFPTHKDAARVLGIRLVDILLVLSGKAAAARNTQKGDRRTQFGFLIFREVDNSNVGSC